MVQVSASRLQAAQPITHGTPCGELDEGHHGELILESELA